jgi:hypothetical protein
VLLACAVACALAAAAMVLWRRSPPPRPAAPPPPEAAAGAELDANGPAAVVAAGAGTAAAAAPANPQRAAVDVPAVAPTARACGAFVDAGDGAPIAGVKVVLSVYELSDGFERRLPGEGQLPPMVSTTQADGRFAFEVEASAELRGGLLAYHPDYELCQLPVYGLEPGGDLDFKNISLHSQRDDGRRPALPLVLELNGLSAAPGARVDPAHGTEEFLRELFERLEAVPRKGEKPR